MATLAAVGGRLGGRGQSVRRVAALALLAVFGVTLLLPSVAERLTQPLVALGDRLSQSADRARGQPGSAVLPSLLLGVATGLLWAPCAGPVLGLILTGAALKARTPRPRCCCSPMRRARRRRWRWRLLVGGRVFAAMKRSLGVGEWIRRGLGRRRAGGVAAIALGLDTGLLTRFRSASTAALEQGLLDRLPSRRCGSANGGHPASLRP